MLKEFLIEFREEILDLANEKTVKLADGRESSLDLRGVMPLFLENLIEFLKKPELLSSQRSIAISAAKYGGELLRLNYTLSHVVHGYGAMCQAITELAHERKARISSKEFNHLNLCLDVAIASAVSEFQFRGDLATHNREVKTLGFLVHELRNSLSSATVAHEMIKQGLVGVGGSTSMVLEENLDRMRRLIDSALSEVRLRTDPEVQVEKFLLNQLVDQILLTARNESGKKSQSLVCSMDGRIEMQTDRQLLLSAVANLVQNAIKYSKIGGSISIGAKIVKANVVIKVIDECGGIKPNIIKRIFEPFVSGGDKSGLGMGLSIVQRSISMIGGEVQVENDPGVGCRFVLKVPAKIPILRKTWVSGKDSVQPRRKK